MMVLCDAMLYLKINVINLFVYFRDEDDPGTDNEADVGDNISVASESSVASQATITPETVSSSSAPAGRKIIISSPLKRSRTVSATNVTQPQSNANKTEIRKVSIFI